MSGRSPIDKIKVEVEDVMLPGIPRINIKFANNGEVTIPGEYGGYVVASGCGSGKTTAIKEIISKCYNRGIVYAAFTIEECNEMYRYCKTIMDEKDIALLHSDYKCEGVNTKLLNQPEKLSDKKVIICTHYKLLNEYPELLLGYNRNRIHKSRLSLLARGKFSWDEDGTKRFPRQLILIDEMPTCTGFSFEVTPNTLISLGIPETRTEYDREGNKYLVSTSDDGSLNFTNGGNFSLTEEIYKSSKMKLTGLGSDEMKIRLALSMIYEDYDELKRILIDNKSKSVPSVKLSYTISDQIASGKCGGETRYIIFDGTGDLTFRNSSIFRVLTFDYKYNSPILVNSIPITYSRRYKSNEELISNRNNILNGINSLVEDMSKVMIGHRTLIITWKNLKVGDSPATLISDSGDCIQYIDYMKICLNERGIRYDIDYSVIHYQSGLDKATNEFRDYDQIIFAGEFHVPGYVVDKFNQDFKVRTDLKSYTLYQLVQAVCRTRIRLHQGLPVNIYFTNDWSDSEVNSLLEYIGNNSIDSEVMNGTFNNIKPKWREAAMILSEIDDEINRHVQLYKHNEINSIYKVEFTLDYMQKLIPMGENKVRSYYPMINYFRKLGIEITITSTNKGRFTSDNNPMRKSR